MRKQARVPIDRETARRLVVQAAGLGTPWPLPEGKDGARAVVQRLGHVQIDTIHVVERAHHHTAWARLHPYEPAMLHALQAHDRRVFEYWRNGAAVYLPIEDYRYTLRAKRHAAVSPRHIHWIERHAGMMEQVLARIRDEGPLRAGDFAPPPGEKRGPWWDWTPAKHALEALFLTGKLMVTERRSFQRVYDLTERALPPDAVTAEPSEEEQARWAARRALSGVGLLSRAALETAAGGERFAGPIVADMAASGDAVPVDFEGGEHFASGDALRALPWPVDVALPAHILSPFDNIAGDRRRLRDLFGFDYRIECYTPAPKRQYGYFCLPVLWGDRFVARVDAAADRKRRILIVRALILEPGVCDDLAGPLSAELHAFAAFNGCDQVAIQRAVPEGFRDLLR